MKLSEVMYRWNPTNSPRPAEEYRGARRNTARLSYRIAKKVEREQNRKEA